MRRILFAFFVCAAATAEAQVQSRPTDPPLVTAVNESWYRLGEPIQFAGDLYYLAGPAVFFNGNTMVRTGHYNGVPLYADTTVEPFSLVFVPIGRGLMQPYERLRRGDLAGTTGSRPPSFPVQLTPQAAATRTAAAAPTAPPLPLGAISVYTPETRTSVPEPPISTVVGTNGIVVPPREAGSIESALRPETNDGIWIQFKGERWLSAGAAVRFTPAEFARVGDYAGFPVYVRRDTSQELIYLPTREDLVAPYRLKR